MKHAVGVFFLASSLCFGATNADNAPPLRSGVDLQYVDHAVRPQDDMFRYLSGKWLAADVIPADRAVYGSFDALGEATQQQLGTIVEGLVAAQDLQSSSDEYKIAQLYKSFIDEGLAETRGLTALRGELAKIDMLADKRGLAALLARMEVPGEHLPINFFIAQDERESTRYAVHFDQGGLGLPDRDYYLKDDARLKNAREAYQEHVRRTLALAGLADAPELAARILALETGIARIQWSKVENRDSIKTYNKVGVTRLKKLMPGFDWKAYLSGLGVEGRADYVIVRQPGYLGGLGKLIEATPLSTWRAYLKWHLLGSYAAYLDKAFVDANFDFYGRTLRGIPEDEPRWKRGIALVDETIGEALGRSYVARHFPPPNKVRMQALVENLISAYRQSIAGLDWMSAPTKKQALAKLDKLTLKIGYPDRWRDFGKLTFDSTDLVGNVMRARRFELERRVSRLDQPIDRTEWEMTPQTVNAYYNPAMNEIVFPAAILQPPFFDVAADDAVNYGSIGAVIGHEISHGFDDEGSRYDGDGNLHDWWSKTDRASFAAKGKALVAQYGAYSPVPGYKVNGELTLGENIADNSGLPIAYTAYRLSLAGKAAPVIDGLTGDQRFCLGWAQGWRRKSREAESVRRVKVDPHSPAQFRANGTLSNLPVFYSAFAVKEGDQMYRSPEQRVHIW